MNRPLKAKAFDPAALEAFRGSAPSKSSWTDTSIGVWVGGRVYSDEFGDTVFVPLGTARCDSPVSGPLTFLGDGVRNVRGFGDPRAPSAGFSEVLLTNPVSPSCTP